MVYYVYLDNFRGFADTCVPIGDVSFLVGENSSGKTSFLRLLKMLGGPGFFFAPRLGDSHVGFDSFSDIVSIHSEDRSYFHVGFCRDQVQSKTEKPIVTCCLFTFENKKEIPKLSKVTFSRGPIKLSFDLRSGISFKRETLDIKTPEELVELLRYDWIKEHNDKDRKLERLPLPASMSRDMPLFIALSLILGGPKSKPLKEKVVLEPPDIDFLPDIIWLAPIRTEVRRTYDQAIKETFSPDGKHTPYVIRRILQGSKPEAQKFKEFFEKVGKESGLFERIKVRSFGRSSASPFELEIELDGKNLNITNVGYGVSQALPVLTEVISGGKGQSFAIQQPEVHLHPRAQAALGDIFFELAVADQKTFVIETHSDFTIDRFRMNYPKAEKVPNGQILFFERKNNKNVVSSIRIEKSGDLSDKQPDSYRKFFIREQMNLLRL